MTTKDQAASTPGKALSPRGSKKDDAKAKWFPLCFYAATDWRALPFNELRKETVCRLFTKSQNSSLSFSFVACFLLFLPRNNTKAPARRRPSSHFYSFPLFPYFSPTLIYAPPRFFRIWKRRGGFLHACLFPLT